MTISDQQLTHQIHTALARIPPGSPYRYGDRKVYISALHHHTQTGLSLEEFKARLVELSRQRLVTLVRADHVAAMDPDRLRASHTRRPGSDFHFIIDPHHD